MISQIEPDQIIAHAVRRRGLHRSACSSAAARPGSAITVRASGIWPAPLATACASRRRTFVLFLAVLRANPVLDGPAVLRRYDQVVCLDQLDHRRQHTRCRCAAPVSQIAALRHEARRAVARRTDARPQRVRQPFLFSAGWSGPCIGAGSASDGGQAPASLSVFRRETAAAACDLDDRAPPRAQRYSWGQNKSGLGRGGATRHGRQGRRAPGRAPTQLDKRRRLLAISFGGRCDQGERRDVRRHGEHAERERDPGRPDPLAPQPSRPSRLGDPRRHRTGREREQPR